MLGIRNERKTSISLNLESRKAQLQENTISNDLSTTIEDSEVFTDDSNKKKLSKDPYLKEALRLLAEMTRNKLG